ncbi:MAG: hypothetical protein LBH48_02480 [Bifidobacteriaceae bacterium]|nr:hypothetical protein [Bifidobacteriaceae bacterium]
MTVPISAHDAGPHLLVHLECRWGWVAVGVVGASGKHSHIRGYLLRQRLGLFG